MFKNALLAIGTAARAFFRNWPAMALLNGLYLALLVALYMFVATKEATVWQLTLTGLLALAAPVLFFMLQAAGIHSTPGAEQSASAGVAHLLRRALRDFWKLFLISVPLILLAVLIAYLLQKLQAYFSAPASDAVTPPPALRPSSYPSVPPPPPPLRWQDVALAASRLLLLGVVLPLAAVHLWISIAREGLWTTLKKSPRLVGRAFAPESILIYAIGLIAFGLMPYFLIFTRTPVENAWAELALFGLRLALAFVFTLWGWVITLGALAKTNVPPATIVEGDGGREEKP